MDNKTYEKQKEYGKKWMKKKRIITSPILLVAAMVIGFNKYKQTKKWNAFMEQVKENTNHVKRAVILGDSVAKGYGSTNGGIANYLKEHLDKRFGKVIVTNEGILHLTSKGLLQKLINEKAYDRTLKESNLVIINIGGNDILEYYHQDGPRAVFKNFLKIRSNYIKNLQHIVQYIEDLNPNLTIVVNSLYNSLEENYQLFGLTSVFIKYWNRSLNQLPVIRVNTGEMSRKEDLWADMVHPNQDGYKELSNLIMKQINMVMEKDT